MITVGIFFKNWVFSVWGPLGSLGPKVNYSATAVNFWGKIGDPRRSKVKVCELILVLTCSPYNLKKNK